MVDQELRRRAFILEPGESLLLASSSIEVALRFGMWERFSQLPVTAVVSNPVVATPLVEYPEHGHPARVWQQVNPAALWHPLFWLPDRVSGRYQIQAEDGTVSVEDDDTWAVRVCLELSMSGLYDAETGTWLDVLAMYGLDIDDPAILDRVRWWQAGDPDPVLDSIDLTEQVDVEDTDWALESALAIIGDLRPASWAMLANDLLEKLDEIADPGKTDTQADPTLTHQAAGNIVALGRTLLAAPEVGVGAQFWTEQELALQQIPPVDFAAVLDGPIAAMSAALYEVRDANWAHLETLEQYGREGEPVPAV